MILAFPFPFTVRPYGQSEQQSERTSADHL